MAIGELVTRLTCDSSNFDSNIRRSQREVQEFRRRAEHSAARINNTFNGLTSVTGRVGSTIGNLASSIGRLGPVLAVVGGAVKGLSEVFKRNEDLMDSWEKKVTQAKGVLDSFYTRLNQPDGFYRFNQNIKETIKILGDYADAIDNIGTFKGFSNQSNSKVNAAIAAFKEAKRNPNSTPEQIAAAKKAAENAIEEADKVAKVVLQSYKDAFKAKVGIIFKGGVGNNSISKKEAFGIISRFSTDVNAYNDIKNAGRSLKDKSEKELLYSPYFKRLLKEFGIERKGLFNPATFKFNIATIDNIRDFFVNLSELVEQGNLTELQDIITNINNQEYLLSTQKNAYYKWLNDDSIGKSGGGGVYTSKQEAPKERTLQDILDDLDKNLDWNKYSAQNLGKDITELNLSSLERTASELEDLLKNTTDEEQRKQILSVLKTINNVINKPKETKKPVNSANNKDDEYKDLYGKELGSFVLNVYSKYNDIGVSEFLNKVKGNYLNNFPKNFYQNLSKGLITNDEVFSPEIAKKFNYSADSFLNSKQASFSKPIRSSIQSVFDIYKDVVSLDAATLNKALKTESSSNYKYISSPYFGDLRKFDIPIKYPEKFYYENLASSKFSSGVLSIVKKYTGFGSFREEFAKNAYSEFDRLISEGKIITPNDVNEILYQIYSDTIKKYSRNAPDLFKNSEEFTKFINNKTKIEDSDKSISSKLRIKIGTKNLNTLFFDNIINNIDTKEAADSLNKNLVNINKIKPIGYDQSAVIDIINKLSENDINIKADLIDKIKKALIERHKTITDYINKFNTSEDSIKLENISNNLKLIQLEKEKRLNKGILSEDKQKEYEELVKYADTDYSGFTDKQLETFEETSKTEEEKLRKAIEEGNKIKEDLINELNQTDEIAERLQKEEEENDVLRERQKELSEISNKYMSVAESAYQIGAAFSTLDSKFGDIASVLLNVVGITAEAIGKLIGMATAKGVSNAFKLPWPQNLAAVATVVAAGASAAGQIAGLANRKYATGGIVSGPGTGISDSIPIRVSNGEMILNHRQQSNLFNLLDKGSSTEGKIEFKNKLVGSDIIGSATTYNKRRNLIL